MWEQRLLSPCPLPTRLNIKSPTMYFGIYIYIFNLNDCWLLYCSTCFGWGKCLSMLWWVPKMARCAHMLVWEHPLSSPMHLWYIGCRCPSPQLTAPINIPLLSPPLYLYLMVSLLHSFSSALCNFCCRPSLPSLSIPSNNYVSLCRMTMMCLVYMPVWHNDTHIKGA